MPTANSKSLFLRMKASPAQTNQTFPWTQLPLDIRDIILEKLGGSYISGRRPRPNPVSSGGVKSGYFLANYAAVCSQWRSYFESILFHKITVRSTDLADLESLKPRCKALIQHLSLHIELDRYNCFDCRTAESVTQREKNNFDFKFSILALLSALSRWPHNKLTLELCAYSPSDAEHYFPHLSFNDHGEKEKKYSKHHGRDWYSPELGDSAVRRLFGNTLSINAYLRWAEISCVKRLLISRQTRRCISARSLGLIIQCFPELESVHIESWRLPSVRLQEEHDEALVEEFMPHLPQNLTSLVLFEDFNEDFDTMMKIQRPVETTLIRKSFPNFSSMLVSLKGLHTLCVSFMADAYDFFSAFCEMEDVSGWVNLTNLSMTSIHLRVTSDPKTVQSLLTMAANSALRMPKLKTLELWYGRRDEACLFRFHINRDGVVTLSRRGTWGLPIHPDAEKAWQAVHDSREGRGLHVPAQEFICYKYIKTHGHAMSHLGLMSEIIHPISLQKIKKDAQRCGSSKQMTLGAAIAAMQNVGFIPHYIP